MTGFFFLNMTDISLKVTEDVLNVNRFVINISQHNFKKNIFGIHMTRIVQIVTGLVLKRA